MSSSAAETASTDTSTPLASRTSLIEARLRRGAAEVLPSADTLVPALVFDELMEGDAGHLHRAHNISDLPIESHRRLTGPVVASIKRMLVRLLYPLPEVQTTWNAANARVVTLLLRQVASQARRIDMLEHQVSDLSEKLDQ